LWYWVWSIVGCMLQHGGGEVVAANGRIFAQSQPHVHVDRSRVATVVVTVTAISPALVSSPVHSTRVIIHYHNRYRAKTLKAYFLRMSSQCYFPILVQINSLYREITLKGNSTQSQRIGLWSPLLKISMRNCIEIWLIYDKFQIFLGSLNTYTLSMTPT